MIRSQTLQAMSVIGGAPGAAIAWEETIMFFEADRAPTMGIVQDWRHPVAWNDWCAISVRIP